MRIHKIDLKLTNGDRIVKYYMELANAISFIEMVLSKEYRKMKMRFTITGHEELKDGVNITYKINTYSSIIYETRKMIETIYTED